MNKCEMREKLNNWLAKMSVQAENFAGQFLAIYEHEEEDALKNNYTSSYSKGDFKKACHYARLSNRICDWLVEE